MRMKKYKKIYKIHFKFFNIYKNEKYILVQKNYNNIKSWKQTSALSSRLGCCGGNIEHEWQLFLDYDHARNIWTTANLWHMIDNSAGPMQTIYVILCSSLCRIPNQAYVLELVLFCGASGSLESPNYGMIQPFHQQLLSPLRGSN